MCFFKKKKVNELQRFYKILLFFLAGFFFLLLFCSCMKDESYKRFFKVFITIVGTILIVISIIVVYLFLVLDLI